jgi:hypothetical protein
MLTQLRLLMLIRAMKIERIQTEIAEMIKNPSWQNKEAFPILTTEEFNHFLRDHLKKPQLLDEACEQMKRQLVNSGFLLDFHKLVILQPQWLADSFKSIISSKNQDDENGIVSVDQIILRLGFGEGISKKLLWIWEKELNVCITSPILRNQYIIPSLLDETRPTELDNYWNTAKDQSECIGRKYSLSFIASGVFEGIFVKSCRVSPLIKFWRNGLLLCKDGDSFLLLEIVRNGKSRFNSSEYVINIQATGKIFVLVLDMD